MSLPDAIAEALVYVEAPPPSEAATCLWIIYPLLRAIGYAPPEINPEGSDGNGQYPDYTVLPGTAACWYLEAKAWRIPLKDSHAHQALDYANRNGRRWVVLTNGRVWRLYDNQVQGLAGDKLVTEVQLDDIPAIEHFLAAISKASVIEGLLGRYARTVRLSMLLRTQFQEENSVVIRALWNALRKEPGLADISRSEIVRVLCQQGVSVDDGSRPGSEAPQSDERPELTEVAREPEVSSLSTQIGLDKLVSCVTGKKPASILLPDGEERPIDNWRTLAREVVGWLGTTRGLPELPYRGGHGGKRYFLNSQPCHQEKPMKAHADVQLNGQTVCIDTHRSGIDLAQHLCDLCQAVGAEPGEFRIRVRDDSP